MIQLFKAKSLKNNTKTKEGAGVSAGAKLTSCLKEKTQEKAILKERIGVNGKLACTKKAGTRGFSFATHTPSKMAFAVSEFTGRSMVEMLGVLAIIGVLSIGGIQGYTIAMRKYRANEILNVANKYATLHYTACQNAMEKKPEKYYISDPGRIGIGDINGKYWWCPASVAFTDSGLGNIPEGALSFNGWQIATAIDPSEEAPGSSGFAEGTDFVVIYIELKSKALCETLYSMLNTDIMQNDLNSFCLDDDYSSVLAAFSMN